MPHTFSNFDAVTALNWVVMFRKALAAVGLLLVVFHGWLFAGQIWDGRLADAALVSRWAIAAGVVFGLWALHRRGGSLFRGRRAVALWLLAAMLHGPAFADRFDVSEPALPETVAVLVQASTGLAALGGLLVLLALVLRARRQSPRPPARVSALIPPVPGPLRSGQILALAPRPPPLR